MVKPSIQRHCRKTPKKTTHRQLHTHTKSPCNIRMPFRSIYLHENWKSSKMKITWFNLKQFTFPRAAHFIHQFDWLVPVVWWRLRVAFGSHCISFPVGFGPFIKRLMKNVHDGEKDIRRFDECLMATSEYQIASVKWYDEAGWDGARARGRESENDGKCAK